MKKSFLTFIISIGTISVVVSVFLLGTERTIAQHKTEQDQHVHSGRDQDELLSQAVPDENEHEGEEAIIYLAPTALKEVGIIVSDLGHMNLNETIEFPGVVKPNTKGEGFVGSLIDGRIREILADIGDPVTKGQPLCTIESPTIGESAAACITASAEMEYIKGDHDRHKMLVDEGIGSKKEQLELAAQLKSSEANVNAAERSLYAIGFTDEDIKLLETDQHSGGEIVIRSPINGTIVDRQVKVGMRINPDHDLFHVVDLNNLRIRFEIPECEIRFLESKSRVTVIANNNHTSKLLGRITRIGGMVHSETRTVVAYAEIDHPEDNLLPGGFVTVKVEKTNGALKVLAVPQEAVFQDEHGDYAVYVEVEQGEFVAREVDTGMRVGGWIEIAGGLSQGDRVVTQGGFALKSESLKGQFGDGHNH